MELAIWWRLVLRQCDSVFLQMEKYTCSIYSTAYASIYTTCIGIKSRYLFLWCLPQIGYFAFLAEETHRSDVMPMNDPTSIFVYDYAFVVVHLPVHLVSASYDR